jgi:hypothetical protein
MQPALDEVWFDRYHAIKIAVGEAYEMLEPLPATLTKLREEFDASDHSINISLLSDRVDLEHYKACLTQLERLRSDVDSSEKNSLLREVYLDAIKDLTATTELIIAGVIGDKERYASANAVLYNQPDEHVFKALCHWIRSDAQKALSSENADLHTLAQKVLDLIPNLQDNHQVLIPSEDVFYKVRQTHRQNNGYYNLLFGSQGLPENAYFTQQEGDEICRNMIANIGADWTVASAENNVWAVMRSRKELVRPAGYRLDHDEFVGVVSHEIGSHILEEVNGQNQPLKLLGTGLAGFEKGNEGRAFLREQIVYESERTFLGQFAWEYIVLLHLSVSLASGSHEKRATFAELYQTLHALYAFWREKRMPQATNNEQFALEEAWHLAVRTMKGTDGLGGAYMKDTVYLEGNIRCWQLAADDPSIILFGDKGMFDITNQRHREIVRSLDASTTATR